MNYQNFFQNRPTTEIAQDLLGRTLTYENNGEILGGLIVETEDTLVPKIMLHTHITAEEVQLMKDYIVPEATYISTPKGNTSSSILLHKKKITLKEF